MMDLYPLSMASAEIPIPVFPDVGSIIVAPGLSRPLASASSMIDLAILSFIEPAGL